MRGFLLGCLFVCLASAAAADSTRSPGALDIRVQGSGWGKASAEQIEPVLRAVAAELLVRLPRKLEAVIVVTHTNRNPITLYDRGPDGAYQVQLHASDERWHLYVFEFAHEFCHVLSNYDENVIGSGRHNQWFEESLCEAASLFALDRLASRWEVAPAGSLWVQWAPKLRRFFEFLAGEEHRRLPANIGIAAWLGDHEQELRKNPYLRDRNDLVAKLLLPFFQRNPESWDALSYLNLDPEDANVTLAGYLSHWHDRAPAAHKAFIADIKSLFAGSAAPQIVAAGGTPENAQPSPIGAASPLR